MTPKISAFHKVIVYFEKIPCSEMLWFTQSHNTPAYDVTGNETPNWLKQICVMWVLKESYELCNYLMFYVIT